ncbi:MAG: alkaline phosphatase family protein [Candidatus Krumholzibacteriota bacterium]|nr:alkaline phosphatase family protein [Candidatus Krumholzibacteriota bacterium]
MKRGILTFTAIAVISAAVYLALNVRRVQPGHEGVYVARDGSVSLVAPGMHLLRPGESIIVYPVGDRSYRVPRDGGLDVLMHDGSGASISLELTLSIPDGSSMRFYESFSADFEAALRQLVENAAETEAARTPAGDIDGLMRRIDDAVRSELEPFGVTLSLRVAPAQATSEQRRVAVNVSAQPPVRLIVLGVDGADWLNIKPMIASGKLPNFRRLVDEGSTGALRSQEPMLSPLLWTTMATGKNPEDHGILNFTVTDPETGTRIPITRLYRQVDAFWNMLSDYNRTVCVAGWLATDPAEKVNGVMVTDKVGYLAYAPDDTSAEQSTGSVYPPDRLEHIASLVVHGRDVPWEEISRMIDVPRAEFEQRQRKPFDPRDSINNLILLYASTRTYRNIALDLLESERPDLLAVYFEFVDAVSHLFMLHAPPRMPDVPEAEYARYRNAVAEAYVIQDEILGEIMGRMDDRTILMVISDHGFKSGGSRLRNRPEIWAGNAAKWHRANGIIGFFGNGVRRGYEIQSASILDVTPTVLALQGLPRAADMPGKVLATAFESDLQAQFNINVVPTLQRSRSVDPGAVTSSTASKETMDKLEALGYLTPDNADAHNNLGQRYQQRGEYIKAIEEYRKALAMRPEFHSVWNNIAVCYGKLGRFTEAEEALRRTIEIKPDDFYAMNNLALLHMQTGRLPIALEIAQRCIATEPGYANGRVTLGSIYATMGDLDRAEQEYRTALELDPENEDAQVNLGRVKQQRMMNQ